MDLTGEVTDTKVKTGGWDLRHKGYTFEVVDMTNDTELRAWLAHVTGRDKAPHLFVDQRPVGGFDDVKALDRSGNLDRLVRGEV